MVIVWRSKGNIIRTALCWIAWHNVHSPQHTHVSSSYRFNRLDFSHWAPYAVRRGGCLQLYYCNMVECFWWDSSRSLTTNWFPSVLWHCWFGHLACKNRPRNDLLCVEWDVKPYTLIPTISIRIKCKKTDRPVSYNWPRTSYSQQLATKSILAQVAQHQSEKQYSKCPHTLRLIDDEINDVRLVRWRIYSSLARSVSNRCFRSSRETMHVWCNLFNPFTADPVNTLHFAILV